VRQIFGGSVMAQWLIADVSLFDAHVQIWMLLVAGFFFSWFLLAFRA
jgi:hypothetical protein